MSQIMSGFRKEKEKAVCSKTKYNDGTGGIASPPCRCLGSEVTQKGPGRPGSKMAADPGPAGREVASQSLLRAGTVKQPALLSDRVTTMPRKKEGAAPAARKAPAKYKLAEEFPQGEVLTDSAKKQWKLGLPIGQGGFGRLYLANENSSKTVGPDAPYVIKVEPSDNGPLFSELKFYMRAAKPDMIQKWTSSHKLKYLGVPKYWGSGLHGKNGKRFMVMDRFGKDLQKIFEESSRRFSHQTVLQLGLRLIDVLEYIHEHEYVHGDIKASNLLLHHKHPDQVFLVDYGLAYRYSPEGVHKEYIEDPRRCHNGTIEFTSIDAHKGVNPSRRGDLEILGYCMIQWLCGKLPWEDKLTDPNYVASSKMRYSDDIPSLIETCFPGKKRPAFLYPFHYRKPQG
ncbi:unnamed protein product [Ranitomeya imitator]|uniref:non-specific serine/threonine protein kinase n=1 Tax=Ranitomeya imitator TaxID=111125 RepID=A0ABN9LQ68_9NEOB|nr:unnamed protein product [Ranitomeya imitator]